MLNEEPKVTMTVETFNKINSDLDEYSKLVEKKFPRKQKTQEESYERENLS